MGGNKKGKNNKKKGEKSKSRKSDSKVSYDRGEGPSGENDVLVDEGNILSRQIYEKIEMAFQLACDVLMAMNYSAPTAQLAMMSGGYITGEGNIIANIVRNSISYINNLPVVDGYHVPDESPIFMNMSELNTFWVQTLVSFASKLYPHATQLKLLQHVLACKSIDIEGIVKDGSPGCSAGAGSSHDHGSSSSASDQTELDIFLKQHIHDIQSFRLTSKPNEGKNNPSDNLIAQNKQEYFDKKKKSEASGSRPPKGSNDKSKILELTNKSYDDISESLVKRLEMEVKDLEAQLKDINMHDQEPSSLRQKKKVQDQYLKEQKIEIATAQISKMLKVDSETRKVTDQLTILHDKLQDVVVEKSGIQSEISASKVNIDETDSKLKQAMKKEKEKIRKAEACDRMNARLKEESNQHTEMIHQLDEQFRATKEALNEIEVRLREELEEKEIANDRRHEERRALRIAKDKMQKMLTSLRQAIEDEAKELENEKNTLYEECRILEEPHLLYDESSGSSSSSSLSRVMHLLYDSRVDDCDIPMHRQCMMCLMREVKILFLPCGHQVICIRCSEKIADVCPCCNIQIEEKVRIF